MMLNPTFAIDTWAMIAALLFGGGAVPLSMPPAAPDQALDRMAPAEPIVFINTSGRAEPAADSRNRTEQLLAEPELTEALRQVKMIARSMTLRNAGNDGDQIAARMAPAFVRVFLTRPWMLYSTTISRDGPEYILRGAFVANLGEAEKEMERALAMVPDEVTEIVQVAGQSFQRIEVHPNAPLVTFGIFKNRLYMTIGDGELEDLLKRAEQPGPQWLAKLRKRFDVPKIASLLHVNAEKLRAIRANRSPLETRLVRAMGLDNLNSLSMVTGLDEHAAVQFTALDTAGGKLQGALATYSDGPLTAADLAGVPRDSSIAVAMRVDGVKVFKTMVSALTPESQQQFEKLDSTITERFGMPFEELLSALGDVWTLHTSNADGGFVSGWTATVSLRERARVVRWLSALEDSLGPAPNLRVAKSEFLDQPYTMLSVADAQIPFAPTWAVTEDRLVVALYPQAVKSYLSRRQRNEPSLSELPKVAAAIEQEPATIATIDNKEILQLAYPLLQMGVRMGLGELRRDGVYVDDSLMPSATSIVRHFGVGVTHSRRTETGLVIEQRQTLPTGSFSAMTPLAAALILPAVERTRRQARQIVSSNNMKQIGIAMHNFHDTFGAFPARYRADADGKPLLSWRVHLLPFVESSPLYDQFHLDEPWDSPHNKKLIAQMPSCYRSPASKAAPGKTTYLAIDAKDSTIVPPQRSEFGEKYQKGARISTIRDGTAYSALVVEANDDHAVIWTKPEDYKPPADDPGKGLRGLPGRHIHILMADASVQVLSLQAATKKFLHAVFTKSGSEPIEIRR